MKRIVFVAVLLLGIAGCALLGADTFIVGVEQSTKDSWQSLSSQFQSSTGITVSVQSLQQNSIAQQVVLQAFTRSGRLHFVMIADSWGSSLSRYFQDLANVASALSARGITGGSLPSCPGRRTRRARSTSLWHRRWDRRRHPPRRPQRRARSRWRRRTPRGNCQPRSTTRRLMELWRASLRPHSRR
jgi:hypothetical protein